MYLKACLLMSLVFALQGLASPVTTNERSPEHNSQAVKRSDTKLENSISARDYGHYADKPYSSWNAKSTTYRKRSSNTDPEDNSSALHAFAVRRHVSAKIGPHHHVKRSSNLKTDADSDDDDENLLIARDSTYISHPTRHGTYAKANA